MQGCGGAPGGGVTTNLTSLALVVVCRVVVERQVEQLLDTNRVRRQPSDLLGEGRRIPPFSR